MLCLAINAVHRERKIISAWVSDVLICNLANANVANSLKPLSCVALPTECATALITCAHVQHSEHLYLFPCLPFGTNSKCPVQVVGHVLLAERQKNTLKQCPAVIGFYLMDSEFCVLGRFPAA